MEELKELTEYGSKLGHTGPDLPKFIADQQALMRDRRHEEREAMQKERETQQQKEREDKERAAEREHQRKVGIITVEADAKAKARGKDGADDPISRMPIGPKPPKLPSFDEVKEDGCVQRFERHAIEYQSGTKLSGVITSVIY
jgi:hypothetical protein